MPYLAVNIAVLTAFSLHMPGKHKLLLICHLLSIVLEHEVMLPSYPTAPCMLSLDTTQHHQHMSSESSLCVIMCAT